MVTDPGKSAVIIVSSSIVILSLLLSIFERPYSVVNGKKNVVDTFWDGFYLVVMTMSTVGYGDFTPKSTMGKFLAMITALWGSFLISILVLTTASIFELDDS